MKLKHILATMLLIVTAFGCTEKNIIQKPVLKFHEDGTFKIVQFADTHYIFSDPRSARVDTVIREILESEKPDLVIFTGDNTVAKPAIDGLRSQFSVVDQLGIPFAYTFGNHDRENGPGWELFGHAKSYKNFMLDTPKDTTIGEAYGDLRIISSKNDSTAAVIYIFDSGDYPTLKDRGFKGWGWIKKGQIDWYSNESRKFTKENGGTPIPSVAYFHIPLPEYIEAVQTGGQVIGSSIENICSPQLNTGLFAEILERNDIIGTFVGHDHNNNFISNWRGVALCYGSFSGGKTTYNDVPGGARVVELHEGKREFRTWIHLVPGGIINDVVYPTCFQQAE